MKKCNFLLVAMVGAIIGVLTSCTPTSSSNNDHSYQNDDETENASSKGWEYFKTVDDLTNEPTSFNAMLESTNSQPSSYGGETKLIMTVSYSVFIKKVVNSVSFNFENDNCRFAQLKGHGFLATFNEGPVIEDWSYLEGA